jgi:predicted lysophospholipase L1 biosynthesis ABC-type transport system permease subunit
LRYFSGSIAGPPEPIYFLPEAQADYSQTNLGSLFLRDIVIAPKRGVHLTEAAVREAMASADPDLPLTFIRTLRDQVSSQFPQQRLIARLTSFFAALSLVLVSVGLYGVTAHSAESRTNEIGVRMALGATRGQVVMLVLRGAFGLVVIGLWVGLPLTFVVGRLLTSQLYATGPSRPVVILGAALALGWSARVAALAPAIRASMMPPSVALRAD